MAEQIKVGDNVTWREQYGVVTEVGKIVNTMRGRCPAVEVRIYDSETGEYDFVIVGVDKLTKG